jgi:hypothetical protein
MKQNLSCLDSIWQYKAEKPNVRFISEKIIMRWKITAMLVLPVIFMTDWNKNTIHTAYVYDF